VGADIKVQQELLRHSTIQSTMNVYTQAMSEGKRAANSVVVRSVLPCETCCGVIGAQRRSEREPMGTEKLLNGCGGPIRTVYTIIEHTVPQRIDSFPCLTLLFASVRSVKSAPFSLPRLLG
jgi:hypothetical protein